MSNIYQERWGERWRGASGHCYVDAAPGVISRIDTMVGMLQVHGKYMYDNAISHPRANLGTNITSRNIESVALSSPIVRVSEVLPPEEVRSSRVFSISIDVPEGQGVSRLMLTTNFPHKQYLITKGMNDRIGVSLRNQESKTFDEVPSNEATDIVARLTSFVVGAKNVQIEVGRVVEQRRGGYMTIAQVGFGEGGTDGNFQDLLNRALARTEQPEWMLLQQQLELYARGIGAKFGRAVEITPNGSGTIRITDRRGGPRETVLSVPQIDPSGERRTYIRIGRWDLVFDGSMEGYQILCGIRSIPEGDEPQIYYDFSDPNCMVIRLSDKAGRTYLTLSRPVQHYQIGRPYIYNQLDFESPGELLFKGKIGIRSESDSLCVFNPEHGGYDRVERYGNVSQFQHHSDTHNTKFRCSCNMMGRATFEIDAQALDGSEVFGFRYNGGMNFNSSLSSDFIVQRVIFEQDLFEKSLNAKVVKKP